MLIATLAALVIQQSAGTIAWETPPIEPEAATETSASITATPVSTLPDWAKADPFAWERSQCSPVIRKDASMEACQVRVRTELAAELGDRLPAGLAPDGIEGCRQVSNGAGGYELTCAPVQRSLSSPPTPVAEVCEERPTRTADGGVSFERECRPATGPQAKDGVSFRLGGD
ncbi:hypothetical protein BH10PSE1_BH10PSE1_15640 [soil metagenome]